jgi:UBX domain-containing protein 1
VVDDGPYRRLDDPNNREFLTSLAKGQTPLEMFEDEVGKGAGGDVVVGLIDKRSEDYVEPFRSFSGAGQSLGSASQGGPPQDDGTVFDPSSLAGPPPPPPAGASSATTTAIQVRLINGQRRVVRLDVNATVQNLAASVGDAASGRFRLVAGFPPQAVRSAATILEAGLKGAQVSMQSVD